MAGRKLWTDLCVKVGTRRQWSATSFDFFHLSRSTFLKITIKPSTSTADPPPWLVSPASQLDSESSWWCPDPKWSQHTSSQPRNGPGSYRTEMLENRYRCHESVESQLFCLSSDTHGWESVCTVSSYSSPNLQPRRSISEADFNKTAFQASWRTF